MTSAVDWIRLTFVQGIGLVTYWRLVDYFRHPSAVFQASKKQLSKIPGLKSGQIDALLSVQAQKSCSEELVKLEKIGGIALCYEDPLYPESLKQLIDSPPVIYAQGDLAHLNNPCVAMVGSRAATSYGKRTAYDLGQTLSRYSVALVSGLALGIDAESHRGMLAGGGATIGVLGCGLDVTYPPQHAKLFHEIAQKGLLLSEYPLGTRPEGFRFPARNRIIAGLSEGVVVVEAARKSGSLITAQIALDYGREIFAVPGQVSSSKSEGTHWLLQQGAKLVQRGEDIIEELGLQQNCHLARAGSAGPEVNLDIDPEAIALLETIDCYPQQRETVIEKSGLSSSRMSELLLFLELEGLIELLPGDKLCKL